MLRERCAGCLGLALDVFADLGETPLADVFEDTAAKAEALPRYRLRAALCRDCGLAQLNDVIDDDLLYGADYGFRTGGSPSSLVYMRNLAMYAHKRAPDGLAVEIGCNDGTLLRELQKLGRITAGFDPSAAVADVAPQQGLNIACVPFTAQVAGEWHTPAALVIAVNVAAHVQDPHDFLEGISVLLADDGVAVVEFQYLPDLLAGGMFDLIYHEHRFFYTLRTFSELAGQHGLAVRKVERTPAQGGSLRVWLGHGWHSDVWSGWVAEEERIVPELAEGFQARADYAAVRITQTVLDYPGIVYGCAASAKSCTLLNRCGLTRYELPLIVDATQSKLGRWAPGTGISIVGWAPDVKPAAYLLLASNYLGGIIRREQDRGFDGQFIVPLPLPVIV